MTLKAGLTGPPPDVAFAAVALFGAMARIAVTPIGTNQTESVRATRRTADLGTAGGEQSAEEWRVSDIGPTHDQLSVLVYTVGVGRKPDLTNIKMDWRFEREISPVPTHDCRSDLRGRCIRHQGRCAAPPPLCSTCLRRA